MKFLNLCCLSFSKLCHFWTCTNYANYVVMFILLSLFVDSRLVYFSFLPAYFQDDIKCHFAASMISGLVTTLASMPVDITKTRSG